MRRISWDTVITAGITAALVLVGWIYSSGQAAGKNTEKDEALDQRLSLVERQITEQLTMLANGQIELSREIGILKAEQRILHKDQMGRLSK